MPSEKIRVIIVDDIAETREQIRRMLQFDTSIEVVGFARTGREAIDLAQKENPDVILMDINMPDMDGITATENIRRKVPFAQVVILSVQSDPSYMRRAMLAGARDFLSKPPMIDELTSAIRRAGAVAHEERAKQPIATVAAPGGVAVAGQSAALGQGKIIVIYSPKGGSGRTSIAVNLALALQSEQTPTALVDLNLQFGDAAVFLNEQGKNTILDLTVRADELDADIVREVMVKHAASGLNILAAPPRPEMADAITADQVGKLLKYLRHVYSYIVVDTASYLTEPILTALEAADITVLVTTQDIPSIKSCNLFLTLADQIKLRRDSILFIMNRYDKRIGISPEKVGESLHHPIPLSIPLDDRLIIAAINRGIPFLVDNKTHPISKVIYSLADLIKDRITKLDVVEQPGTTRR
ncbi:MAG: response regulator [Anaerolinea sp.]|nr:response regulator [Anaerolinea sp.]